MKKQITIFLLTIMFGISAFAQTIASATGNWNNPATWTGGIVPSQGDNIFINDNVVVTVNTDTAKCNSVSFGSNTAQLAMAPGSVLSVYGDFTIFSTAHIAFSAWAAGAKLRFTGTAATQTLSGWGTAVSSGTSVTRLMEIEVNKSSGMVTTSGTGMKFVLGTSLDIISGMFRLGSGDDMEGRDMTGTASTPTITVQANGTFQMVGVASYIRSGATTTPIGKVVLYGNGIFISTSATQVNLGNVDIESGGHLILPAGWSANLFNPGTVTVKNGGEIVYSAGTNVWLNPATTLNLQQGGTFATSVTTTYFPTNFTNNGTVSYQKGSGTQTIVDMDYYHLQSLGASVKSWDLTTNRTVNNLETVFGSTLTLTAAVPETLHVTSNLQLTAGTINNSNANIKLSLSDNAIIVRDTGAISTTPLFGTNHSVEYKNNKAITTGPELPSSVKKLTLSNTQSTKLNANLIVTDTVICIAATDTFSTGSNTLTLGSNAVLVEDTARYIVGTVTTARTVGTGSSTFGNIGVSLNAGTDDLGDVTVTRTAGPGRAVTINANTGINRQWNITSNNPPTNGRNVTFSWPAKDDNAKNMLLAELWKNDGTWSSMSTGDVSASNPRTMTASTTSFSLWTVSDTNSPLPVQLASFSGEMINTNVKLSWSTISEINNDGFAVERKENNQWKNIGYVKGNGNSNEQHHYTFIDKNVITGKNIYRLKQTDRDGKVNYSNTIEVITLPKSVELFQNFPNPYNPTTTINYQLPNNNFVTLKVYNLLGEEIATLVNGEVEAGVHEVQFDGSKLSSGIYFYKLTAGKFTEIKKMMLIK